MYKVWCSLCIEDNEYLVIIYSLSQLTGFPRTPGSPFSPWTPGGPGDPGAPEGPAGPGPPVSPYRVNIMWTLNLRFHSLSKVLN